MTIQETMPEGSKLWLSPGEFELPKDMLPQLVKAVHAANVAAHEMTRLLGQYEMYMALSDRHFLERIDKGAILPGVNTLRMTLLRGLLVGIVAIFDDNSGSTTSLSLKSIVTTALDRKHLPVLEAYHIRDNTANEMECILLRLAYLRRRMKYGRFPVSFGVIAHPGAQGTLPRSASWTAASTVAPRVFAVLTTERNAA